MKVDFFLDNIGFVFCDNRLQENARETFIEALETGIEVQLDQETLTKISAELEDEVNLTPLPLMAKNIGSGIEVYYRSSYLLNFEYDTMYESWYVIMDFTDVEKESLSTIPLLYTFLYNALVNNIEKYENYVILEFEAEQPSENLNQGE